MSFQTTSWKKKLMAPGQPTCQHSLLLSPSASLPRVFLSVSLTPSVAVAHSVVSFLSDTFEKWQTNETTCTGTHIYAPHTRLVQHTHTKKHNPFIQSVYVKRHNLLHNLRHTHPLIWPTTQKEKPLTHALPPLPGVKPHWVLLHLVMWLQRSHITLTIPCRDREMEGKRKNRGELGRVEKQIEWKRWEMFVCPT